MSIHYNSIIPSGGGSGSDPTKLPLTGGTLTGNLIIDAGAGSAGHYETTKMFVTRTDADTGAGESNAYGALYNGGVEVGDISGNWAELTPAHIRFGDETIQVTAGLPLTGGTLSGNVTINNNANFVIFGEAQAQNGLTVQHAGFIDGAYNNAHGEWTGENIYLTVEPVEGGHAGFNAHLGAYDGFNQQNINGNTISVNASSGITFPDSTIQTTAGILEAPMDGNAYVRKDGAWVDITTL
jgi:hypothetical protein